MKANPKILVIGSANMDLVVNTPRFPKAGETIIGGEFLQIPGGKGANQAVAAKRLGGDVNFVCRLGQDGFGVQNLKNYKNEGMDTSYIKLMSEFASGVALITVDEKGENTIIVSSGANHALSPADLKTAHGAFDDCDILLIQLEIPLETVRFACEMAYERGVKIILNPAPARNLPSDLLQKIYLITPNETEAEHLTGIRVTDDLSAKKACEKLGQLGVENSIITLGEKGAFVYTEDFVGMIATEKVKVIDSTAAGDTFNGAISVALGQNKDVKESVKFALKAATLSVQHMGAQSSIPYLNDVL